ncbi:MAG: CBS domain-containing protein [Acidimicrobiales bacterium]
MRLSRLLEGRTVATTPGRCGLREAATRMRELRIGSLLVMDDGRVVGLLTEPDVVDAFARHGADAERLDVAHVMRRDVPSCRLDDTLEHVMAAMTANGCRYVAVYDESELVGLLSIGDVVKRRLSELEHEARLADSYLLWSR